MTAIDIRGLTVEYVRGAHRLRVLDSLDARVDDGELALLLGPSGCGKTTLLSCIAGILTPTSGTVVVDGIDIGGGSSADLLVHRRRRVGVVFQAFNLVPSLTALDNVALPLLLAGARPAEARRRASELLERLELHDRLDHLPADLSGGQQQRVAIARALVHDPPIVIADEPTANLDYVQAEAVIRALAALRRPGRLVLVSTHDSRLMKIADRVIDLSPIAEAAAADEETVTLPKGTVIFRQGDRGDLVYGVESGQVEILQATDSDTDNVVSTLGPGQYFGELGPLLGFPRSATARALTEVVLTAWSSRKFRDEVLDATAVLERRARGSS